MAKKLLVADDSLTIQKVIKLALSGDGYEIQTVSDGTECLQQAALFRPDVILIDVSIPGRSAFDIKKAANDDPELARIPFVLMSSAFEKIDEAKVALLRFDGRLTKPFDPANLKSVLQAALKMNSGEALKEFTPPSPPPAPFSLEPSDRSKLISKTLAPLPIEKEDVTGEIRLSDPGLIHSPLSTQTTATPPPHPSMRTPEKMDMEPIWNEAPLRKIESVPPMDDSDIKHLTQSTVKMSGLDELGGWNIEEPAKSSLPPIPDIFGQTGFHSRESTSSLSAPSIPLVQDPIDMESPLQLGSATPEASPLHHPPTSSTMDVLVKEQVERQVQEHLERMVEGAVKTHLEQMAKKALPDIAERVVKAEIRRILEDLARSGD